MDTTRRTGVAATLGAAAAMVAAVLALGGCAEGDRAAAPEADSTVTSASPPGGSPNSPAAGQTPTATQPTVSPPANPSSPRPTEPEARDLAPTARPWKGSVITVVGRVRQGVEAGCVAVDTNRGRYTLIGASSASALKPGARVEITGRLEPDIVSICQEGQLLRVLSVRAR